MFYSKLNCSNSSNLKGIRLEFIDQDNVHRGHFWMKRMSTYKLI